MSKTQDKNQFSKSIPDPITEKVDFLGEELTFELNHYAYKADAAITVQKGETVILATVSKGEEQPGMDYVPLSIEYIEKYYAGGVISSSRFVKRETRPSAEAVLKARQVDHSLRSLFPKAWRKPTSLVITVLAYDGENDPEQLAVIGASTALMLSSVPFFGPSASVAVGIKNDEMIWAPNQEQSEDLDTSMIVSVADGKILNIEGYADEAPEEKIEQILKESIEKTAEIIDFQKKLAEKYGKEKDEYAETPAPEELIKQVKANYSEEIENALRDKENRRSIMTDLKKKVLEEAQEKESEDTPEEEKVTDSIVELAVEYVARKIMRSMVLEKEERTSGRALDEVRPLKTEAGVLPRVHGSAVFTRGMTQVMGVLTLGSTSLAQMLESFEGEDSKRFMLHYNSPNFSFGDAGRYSYYPGRREIGHGHIGENGLKKLIPSKEEFPYTIRISSDVMSSNGSTSMASVCAASLALYDGGVPIRALVGGVAMGLVTDDDDQSNYKILTDMEDVEDFYGDMDFKVTGTKKGVTAIQLDNKLKGIPAEILISAMEDSRKARLHIIETMEATIAAPRAELNKYAPVVEKIKIKQDKIGDLIGPGGKTIKGILEACEQKVEIDIDEEGIVLITSEDKAMREKAIEMVNGIVEEAEVGKTYTGKIGKITEYGMFVDVSPNISGLVHISEVKDKFVKDLNKLYKEGEEVKVKVTGIDDRGRLKLSMKQAEK